MYQQQMNINLCYFLTMTWPRGRNMYALHTDLKTLSTLLLVLNSNFYQYKWIYFFGLEDFVIGKFGKTVLYNVKSVFGFQRYQIETIKIKIQLIKFQSNCTKIPKSAALIYITDSTKYGDIEQKKPITTRSVLLNVMHKIRLKSFSQTYCKLS